MVYTDAIEINDILYMNMIYFMVYTGEIEINDILHIFYGIHW